MGHPIHRLAVVLGSPADDEGERQADRDHDEGGVEARQRVGAAEEHQPAAEHQHAHADHALRPEAVDEPAEDRAEDRDLHLLQRRRARERGLAPAALLLQHRDVGAEGLGHEAGLEELQPRAGCDHVPAVENAPHAGRIGVMNISMYQASAPRFAGMLRNLSALLDKAQAYCDAKKIEPAAITGARLFPDMYPLTRQVQIACDTAKGAVARLAGIEIPKHEDTEQTFAELKGRIAKTLAFIESVRAEKIDGAEEREIVLKMRS